MDKYNTIKLFIQDNKTKLLVASVFTLILVTSTFMFLNIDSKTKTVTQGKVFANLNKKDESNSSSNNNNLSVEDEYIYIDVKGEVTNPGVYSLKSDKRVVDAINLAGGLKDSADTTLLNLSLKLADQMVIVVYSKDEINNIELLKEKLTNDKEICNTVVKNDACIANNSESLVVPDIMNQDSNDESNNNSNNESDAKENIDNKININTAPLEMLVTLPKIGQVKAKAIIDYRTVNGNFKDITDIKNVKGIGDSLFEAIKKYITI